MSMETTIKPVPSSAKHSYKEKAEAEAPPVALKQAERGVYVLTFDLPGKSVNVLSRPVMDALDACLDRVARLEGNGSEHSRLAGQARGLLIRSAKPGCFIAGADVEEISRIADEATAEKLSVMGQRIFGRIEALAIPSAALIGSGTCLGGGLELALACDWRLVSAVAGGKTSLGLPEVKLGLLPGWGGTQRLPRVVGLRRALDLILSGRAVDAHAAVKIGLADAFAPDEDAVVWAVNWLADKADAGERNRKPKRARGRSWLERSALGRRLLFRGARKKLQAKVGAHYPAPYRALDSIANSARLPLDKGLAREAALFAPLALTPASRGLLHVFDLQQAGKRAVKKIRGKRTGDGAKLDSCGVIGAGLMGSGIAAALASSGIRVRLKDIEPAAVARGLARARQIFDEAVIRRKIDRAAANACMQRISPTTDMSGFGRAQVVIEAVAEDLAIKRQVLEQIEAVVAADCVIATNTSSLRVSDLAAAAAHPERVLGLHFFNPAHKMPLVEVVLTERTSAAAAARAVQLISQLGKTPVIVRDVPGFLVNRILLPYLIEALYLLTEGTGAARIDRAMRAFGMPMGPLELIDQIGLPIAGHVARHLAEAYGPRMAVPSVLELIAAQGLEGSEGINRLYRKPGRIHPRVTALAKAARKQAGFARRRISDDELVERLLAVMIAEAARCLDEGVAASAADVDLALVFGAGFPPFRGGLLKYADSELGLARVVERLDSLREAGNGNGTENGLVIAPGKRYRVPERLARAAAGGEKLYSEG